MGGKARRLVDGSRTFENASVLDNDANRGIAPKGKCGGWIQFELRMDGLDG